MNSRQIMKVIYSITTILWISYFVSVPLGKAQSVEDLVEYATPSVVMILVYDNTGSEVGQGSGFFVGPGKILTNAHVMKDAYSAEIYSSYGLADSISILKIDETVDLSLLQILDVPKKDMLLLPWLTLAETPELRPGQRVLAIGNPLGLESTVSDGMISAIRGIGEETQLIQITAPISPGSSGGPLLDMEGQVIGVTTATMAKGQNLNFAVGITTLENFLKLPNSETVLNKAKASIGWKVALKWVKNVFLWIIAVLFGGSYFGYFLIVVVLYFGYFLIKGIWFLISWPFKNK